jgi:hypothetical protein
VNTVRVGQSGFPLVCVDGFFEDPGALVTQAREAAFIDGGSVYPGVRAPAPVEYVSELLRGLSGVIEQAFGARPEEELELCAWSLVTTPRECLRPIQRIPHFDGPEPTRIALLHYLCGPDQGGTSFYRHRATGLECVTPGSVERYREKVAAELAAGAARGGYVTGDSPQFERIHAVAAAFDRVIVYPGNALHSGDIGADTVLDEDPARGRLTLNSFGFLRRPG